MFKQPCKQDLRKTLFQQPIFIITRQLTITLALMVSFFQAEYFASNVRVNTMFC